MSRNVTICPINLRIKQIIEEKGLKKSAVANSLKMGNDTLSHILHNKRRVYANEIPAFCKALGVDCMFLIYGEGA